MLSQDAEDFPLEVGTTMESKEEMDVIQRNCELNMFNFVFVKCFVLYFVLVF